MGGKRFVPVIAVPAAIVVFGTIWMQLAVQHYERKTGREFYSLAGYHYSLPQWGFDYHPGGESIADWTVVFPSNATLLAILVAAMAFTFTRRDDWLQLAMVWFIHAAAAVCFSLISSWFWINVMGVFI